MVYVQIRADSDLPEDQVIGFDTEGELHDFVYNNPNTTQGGNEMLCCEAQSIGGLTHAHATHDTTGYVFNVSQVGGDTVVGFTLLTNQTNQMRYGKVIKYATYVQVPMMVALQRQLCALPTTCLPSCGWHPRTQLTPSYGEQSSTRRTIPTLSSLWTLSNLLAPRPRLSTVRAILSCTHDTQHTTLGLAH